MPLSAKSAGYCTYPGDETHIHMTPGGVWMRDDPSRGGSWFDQIKRTLKAWFDKIRFWIELLQVLSTAIVATSPLWSHLVSVGVDSKWLIAIVATVLLLVNLGITLVLHRRLWAAARTRDTTLQRSLELTRALAGDLGLLREVQDLCTSEELDKQVLRRYVNDVMLTASRLIDSTCHRVMIYRPVQPDSPDINAQLRVWVTTLDQVNVSERNVYNVPCVLAQGEQYAEVVMCYHWKSVRITYDWKENVNQENPQNGRSPAYTGTLMEPIMRDGTCIGVLCFYRQDGKQFTQLDQALGELYAVFTERALRIDDQLNHGSVWDGHLLG